MQIAITNIFTSEEKTYSGTPEAVREDILRDMPWLATTHLSAEGLLAKIAESDAYILRAPMVSSSEALHKGEIFRFDSVAAPTAREASAAAIIDSANKKGIIEPIALGGRHSNGTLLASPPEDSDWLLKPGAGEQGDIMGASESGSSQSKREACFSEVAREIMGIPEVMEAYLLLLDGKEYVAMPYLGHSYETAEDYAKRDQVGLGRLLASELLNCYKWAAMDYILGNGDDHGGNQMISGATIRLIDHGSAFAGGAFDPALDPNVRTPFPLRFQIQGHEQKSADERIRTIPRLNAKERALLGVWLQDLSVERVGNVLAKYGIQTEPTLKRLHELAGAGMWLAPDIAVITAWERP